MKKLLIILALAALSSCTMGASVSDDQLDKHMRCVDTRDGETFTYYPRNILEARAGVLADSFVELVDDDGKVRKIYSSEGAFWKCETL